MFTHTKHSLAAFQAAQRHTSLRTKIVASMVAFSVVTSLIVAGCGGGGTSVAQNNSKPYAPFTPTSDLLYMDALMPHHMHAVEMAQHQLDNGSSSAIKAIAQKIKDDQTAEIALYKTIRKSLTGSENSPAVPDSHMESDMRTMMTKTGGAADAFFIQHMIPHHAEGISLAHRGLPNLRDSRLVANAKMVISTQSREIGQMEALRIGDNY